MSTHILGFSRAIYKGLILGTERLTEGPGNESRNIMK
jgi:hypothetical protein